MDRRVSQILVVHPGSLGDTILALPVLAALKEHYQPTWLHLIGHPSLLDVLPGRSVVDSMASIEGSDYRELLAGYERMSAAAVRFYQQFALVVIWAADHDGSVRAALDSLGIPQGIVRSPGLQKTSDQHATERFRETLGCLLPSESLPETGLTPTENDRESGARWLLDHGIDPEADRVVAAHAGSGMLSKCWPSVHVAAVIQGLLEEGIKVVLIEGPADAEATRAVTGQVHRALPRLQAASLSLVLGVLGRCGGFLGNDSGVTQMATALGLPTVAVFGPTDPGIWGYRGKRLVALRSEFGCRCASREAQQMCSERMCLSTPSEIVLNALRQSVRSVTPSLAT
jgi:ADP-heptose:LPS heptosyltransferase